MASIRREIVIEAAPEAVWAVLRDFGAVHQRLVPGFVVDARLEGETRIVTQVFAEGEAASRFVWITDVLPHALAERLTPMMERGLHVIRQTLAGAARA